MSNNTFNQIVELCCLIFFLIFLVGCGEDAPYLPRTYYEDIENVVIRDVKINSVKSKNGPIFNKNSKIAVLTFKSPEKTQGGVLVSDIFSLFLQEKGFNVVERDYINKILQEQKIIMKRQAALSDLEIANKIGKLVAADFMVFGAVTLYNSEGQIIYLPIRIKKEDRDDYTKDYNIYREWYVNKFWPIFDSKQERVKKLRNEINVLSLEELEEEYKKVSKTEFKIIASIGISAKIVEVKSTKIYWMGQAETVDFTLVNGTNRIVEKFFSNIQSND